ncbi:MAG TPA: hypothetical protein VGE55_06825 [Limnobacter sp.]|uniref:hypothetical protein n=1 Tax=Limnobacter sp. TaxID=2003368 RepID=UPI002ED90CAF
MTSVWLTIWTCTALGVAIVALDACLAHRSGRVHADEQARRDARQQRRQQPGQGL